MESVNNTPIKLNFHPFEYDLKHHTIEKSEDNSDQKHKYLVGISSGMKLDQHGERLTGKAVNSLMFQANSGTILLYPDVHGIKASEDIGILKEAKILPNGDWYTEFRLYDESDGIPQSKLDVIDTIWKQINGIAPYSKPIQKGFSIEGYIPPGGILEMAEDGRRVIDDVKLDGVLLVPRPAYKDGIANAIYKALGELSPWQAEIYQNKIRKTLQEKIQEKKDADNFYSAKFELQDTLENEIEKTMNLERFTQSQKTSEINLLFDEYKKAYIDLMLSMPHIFQNGIDNSESRRAQILKSLNKNYEILKSIVEKKRGKNNEQ